MSQRDRNWLVRHTKIHRERVLSDITIDLTRRRDANDHPRTVQRFLHEHDVKRRVVRKKMAVSQVNRKKRMSWCLEERKLTVNNYWNSVIFSDEIRSFWVKTTEYTFGEHQKKRSFPNACVLRYREGCLLCNKPYRFQDDNAPVHRAHITRDYKLENNIPTIVWPAQSPDINIIENLWLRIKRILQNRQQNVTTPEELVAVVSDIWISFDQNYIRTLYDSIPRRLLAVIKSKGHLTKY
ncbi:uncharacterized protein LOC134239020 [Saccostrea cucullata]|uniref:uncharacterized protein LOC134239020 n=1 Tax=Saccostrea cuccullata TaxID=36930 RepID=UPI002ED15976